ncbi:MAG: hypothetical protein ACI9VN_003971 [Patescibacteria group bacterium]
MIRKKVDQVDVLAFSVGATIAWKAMLAGLKVDRFYGVSGTRLRYETEKPDAVIELLYGESDLYKPKEDWFKQLNIRAYILKEAGHELYKESRGIEYVCEQLKADVKPLTNKM